MTLTEPAKDPSFFPVLADKYILFPSGDQAALVHRAGDEPNRLSL